MGWRGWRPEARFTPGRYLDRRRLSLPQNVPTWCCSITPRNGHAALSKVRCLDALPRPCATPSTSSATRASSKVRSGVYVITRRRDALAARSLVQPGSQISRRQAPLTRAPLGCHASGSFGARTTSPASEVASWQHHGQLLRKGPHGTCQPDDSNMLHHSADAIFFQTQQLLPARAIPRHPSLFAIY